MSPIFDACKIREIDSVKDQYSWWRESFFFFLYSTFFCAGVWLTKEDAVTERRNSAVTKGTDE